MSQPEQKEDQKNTTPTTKPQRKLKFKTLDGKIEQVECDFDIKISELKKKLTTIYNIEPNRQRLINKGKQFKDDDYLDKLVDKDDTTIHLVFRSEEDVKRAQENAQNNTNQNQNQNTQNISPFQNIISVVSNSDQFRNFTNDIVNQIFSRRNNNNNSNANNNTTNNNNNNTNNENGNNITIQGTTRFQTINLGDALNLSMSPLQTPQPSTNIQNPPSIDLNVNNNNSNNINTINPNQNNTSNTNNDKSYSSQFPISVSQSDKKYEMHLKKIENELTEADKIISEDIQPKIPLPLLNTTQNVFTAISRSIRKYVIVNQNILCHLMRLSELMEREQFITQSEVRLNGNKLLDQAYKSLAHISKASNDLSNVIKSSNFNTAPNTGYIGIICQEIGMQSTSIPLPMGGLNSNSILSALRNQNNNNANSNVIRTTINLNNLGNNQNQTNLGNIGGTNITSIPISISVIDSSEPPILNNNINNNVNNNVNTNNNQENSTNNNATNNDSNNPINNNDVKTDQDKKEKEENKQKENNNTNNTNTNNSINNTQQNIQNNNNNNNNNNTNQNDENNINNLFGTVMNRLMTPENINSISEAVDSLMNNNNQGNFNIGNLIGNLVNSLNIEENQTNNQPIQPTTQQTQPPQQNQTENKNKTANKEPPKPKEKKEETPAENNSDQIPIFKKLTQNEELRKKTRVGDEKIIGEAMAPNIELVLFSNEIISNLTIQDIFDMYNLNFTGLCRMRKDIKTKYFTESQKNEEKIKTIVELLCERLILIENDTYKLKLDKEFILEDFFNIELKKILQMFIDDNELNLTEEQWETKFKKLVIDMLIKLINELKNIYETGEEGAKYFIQYNIIVLIENFIGTKYLDLIQKYDKNVINNFVDNLFSIVKNEEIKNKCNNEIKEDKKDEKNDNKDKDNQSERPSLLSVEEIFKIAQKDKERLEKEDKNENNNKKYSEFYYLTSLFK